LTLCRPPCERTFQIKVKPEAFNHVSVERVRAKDQYILRIRGFTAGQTRLFLKTAMEHMDPKQPAILDLREAMGGDLFEAMDTAALFLQPGMSLGMTRDRTGDEVFYKSPNRKKLQHPLILLAGEDTASAAEIFTGILKTHKRAIVVGTRTYGKCRSQTDHRLSDGSVLRYTNLEVFLPDGAGCHGKGIVPDRTVPPEKMADTSDLVRIGKQALRSMHPAH
jgi:carboxyl-terminal processing protease